MNYIIYGEEQYQIKKQIEAMIKKELGMYDKMAITYYDAMKVATHEIIEDAYTIPFLNEKKCIIVEHATCFTSKNTSKLDLESIHTYLQNPMDTTILIFTGNFSKCDQRKKIVKECIALCKVIVCNLLDRKSLPNYINEQISKRHFNITEDAKLELIKRSPCDLQWIQMELDKLQILQETITIEVVKQLIPHPLEEDVFALVDAVVKKDIAKSFAIWNDLKLLNKDPIYLLALLASQFHLLFEVSILLQKNNTQETIAKILNVHPYRVKLAIPICYSITQADILKILHQIATLDLEIKSGKIDKFIGFELFLIQVKGNKL